MRLFRQQLSCVKCCVCKLSSPPTIIYWCHVSTLHIHKSAIVTSIVKTMLQQCRPEHETLTRSHCIKGSVSYFRLISKWGHPLLKYWEHIHLISLLLTPMLTNNILKIPTHNGHGLLKYWHAWLKIFSLFTQTRITGYCCCTADKGIDDQWIKRISSHKKFLVGATNDSWRQSPSQDQHRQQLANPGFHGKGSSLLWH